MTAKTQKSLLGRLAEWEEWRWSDIIERAAEKYPDWFWKDAPDKPRIPIRWEPLLMSYWPGVLSFSYWHYLFGKLEGGHWGGYDAHNWINLPEWGEWRYFLKDFHWWQLFEETKLERLWCRFKGHPKGEVYWNPGGDEPDHHCSTCGENIG